MIPLRQLTRRFLAFDSAFAFGSAFAVALARHSERREESLGSFDFAFAFELAFALARHSDPALRERNLSGGFRPIFELAFDSAFALP